MNRREFTFTLGVGSSILLSGSPFFSALESAAQQNTGSASAYNGKAIDIHTHLPPKVELGRIIENFDRAGH